VTTYYHTISGSRFADSGTNALAAEDVDVTGHTPADDFCLACHFYNEISGKNPASTTLTLQWRNVTDTGSWTDLGSTGELNYSADTVLVNNDPFLSAFWLCSVLGAGYGDVNGIEIEGANANTMDLGPDEETEWIWAIDASGAGAGDEYEFRIYDSTRATYMTVVPTITMSSASASESPSESPSEVGISVRIGFLESFSIRERQRISF
jgi:hypothetical protein